MKRIYFLRHGKAAPMNDSDIFRVLTSDGKHQVNEVATKFKKSGNNINLIISSPATRAKETAEIFQETLDQNHDILFEHFIYEGYSTDELINYFNDLPQIFDSILFVGHNPNISRIIMNLSIDADIALAPADIIGLEFNIDFWSQLESRSGEIMFSVSN